MKTIKYFALFALIVSVLSCSDDDSITPVNKDTLTGTYQLNAYSSVETKTEIINGFEIETTTSIEGDTFDMHYSFQDNDTVVLNGTYRLVETKKLNEQTSDTSYIVNIDNKALPYQINTAQTDLTIGETTYLIKNFNESSFTLVKEETDSSRIFTEKLKFLK